MVWTPSVMGIMMLGWYTLGPKGWSKTRVVRGVKVKVGVEVEVGVQVEAIGVVITKVTRG